MPPSGYSLAAVNSIEAYLRACVDDLRREMTHGNQAKKHLEREIGTIENAVKTDLYTPIAKEVMVLIQAFYRKVLERVIGGLPFDEAASLTIDETSHELTNLKI